MSGVAVHRVASDELELELLPELGGRLHRLRAFGADLLRTPDDPAVHRTDPFFWGAYVMAPWCNRAAPGPSALLGRGVDLAANFADGTAIHGLVSAVPWEVRDDGRFEVRGGGDGRWPWPFSVSADVGVQEARASLQYRLQNEGGTAMPAGIGLHPWFRRPVELRVPAARVFPSNTGSPSDPDDVDGAHDLRDLAPPADDLDGTWADLAEPSIQLAWPSIGITARLEIAAPRAFVAVATPSALDAIAVEPQTHAPDGLRRLANGEPDGVALLEPGAVLDLTLTLELERAR